MIKFQVCIPIRILLHLDIFHISVENKTVKGFEEKHKIKVCYVKN